jgi:hypothetical protein
MYIGDEVQFNQNLKDNSRQKKNLKDNVLPALVHESRVTTNHFLDNCSIT